jgi:hypothetical protein
VKALLLPINRAHPTIPATEAPDGLPFYGRSRGGRGRIEADLRAQFHRAATVRTLEDRFDNADLAELLRAVCTALSLAAFFRRQPLALGLGDIAQLFLAHRLHHLF